MQAPTESVWTRVKTLGRHRGIRWLASGLIFVFSIVFLGGMLFYYWPALSTYPWKITPLPIVAGCVIYCLDLLLAVFGWALIMRHLAVDLNFRDHLRIYCLTLVTGRIPGAPWHIAGRAVLYSRLGISAKVIGVAAAVEMLLVTLAGLLSGLFIWFSLPESTQQQLVWLGLVFVGGLGLMHPSVIREVLRRLGYADAIVRLRYRDMLLLLGLYVLVWGASGGVLYSVILALYPLPLMQLPGVIGAWGLAGAVSSLAFLSPTGFGIKEIALSLLLALFVPAGLAVVIVILNRLFFIAAELAWAIAASRL